MHQKHWRRCCQGL